jgi:hypothetical protein
VWLPSGFAEVYYQAAMKSVGLFQMLLIDGASVSLIVWFLYTVFRTKRDVEEIKEALRREQKPPAH